VMSKPETFESAKARIELPSVAADITHPAQSGLQ